MKSDWLLSILDFFELEVSIRQRLLVTSVGSVYGKSAGFLLLVPRVLWVDQSRVGSIYAWHGILSVLVAGRAIFSLKETLGRDMLQSSSLLPSQAAVDPSTTHLSANWQLACKGQPTTSPIFDSKNHYQLPILFQWSVGPNPVRATFHGAPAVTLMDSLSAEKAVQEFEVRCAYRPTRGW